MVQLAVNGLGKKRVLDWYDVFLAGSGLGS
jgi:hypothetical protein